MEKNRMLHLFYLVFLWLKAETEMDGRDRRMEERIIRVRDVEHNVWLDILYPSLSPWSYLVLTTVTELTVYFVVIRAHCCHKAAILSHHHHHKHHKHHKHGQCTYTFITRVQSLVVYTPSPHHSIQRFYKQ